MTCYDTATTLDMERAVYFSQETSASEMDDVNEPSSGNSHKQRIDLSRLPIKTSFQRVALEDENARKETMSKNEIDELRKSVLQCNRPLNPWYERKSYENKSTKTEETLPKRILQHQVNNKPHAQANDNGSSLKQQLLEQQKQKRIHRNTDVDMSKAIASEIRLLEQLEIEHLRRVNDLTMLHSESSSKSGGGDTRERNSPVHYVNGRTTEYDGKRNNERVRDNNVMPRRGGQENARPLYEKSERRHKNYDAKIGQRPSHKTTARLSTLPLLHVIRPDSGNTRRSSYINSPYILDEPSRESSETTLPKCHSCGERIHDVILQALGASYHSRCFRCAKCNQCLDGIPFAVDTMGKVFCMDDYETIFIPACVACHKPISAINEFGQIIRIVFRNLEYHIECFNCEGCGLQLSNEQPNRCYSLSSHILCRNCHLHWKLLGDVDAPITDL